MGRNLLIAIMAGLLTFGVIGSGCTTSGSKVESGIVVDIKVKMVPGSFFSPSKTLTIVTFKDGRSVVFKGIIQKIWLNRCNEFRKAYWSWNATISAHLCD